MNLSYWERKSWFSNIDFTIVGSGIVGLNCALYLRKHHPQAKILILEKGILPQGASTKNAGFACFGSLSEIVEDLKTHSEQEVIDIIQRRWDGLQLLRNNLGDEGIDYQQLGGYELFNNNELFEECRNETDHVNELLKSIFYEDVFSFKETNFGFENCIKELAFNVLEAQIDAGKMMSTLLQRVQELGVMILNNVKVVEFSDGVSGVAIKTTLNDFNTHKLIFATNGFARELLDVEVKPARAQVLITKPIENLPVKGTFHLDKGYYYFRNIDDRLLLGGGRNLDFQTEETTDFGQTEVIQNKLRTLLTQTILPNRSFEIDTVWSGIMGIGEQKKAIVKQITNNVFCGLRLGGMGIAIGSTIGKELAAITR